jgi:hypothetical protein
LATAESATIAAKRNVMHRYAVCMQRLSSARV